MSFPPMAQRPRPRRSGGGSLKWLADQILGGMRELSGKNFSRQVDFHVYRLLFSAIDNGASSTQTVQVESASNFIWATAAASVRNSTGGLPFLTYQGALVNALPASWPLRVQIVDAGDGHDLQNAAYPLGATFGDVAGNGPMPLARPRLWPANTTISCTLTRFAEGQLDAAGAATNFNVDVELMFIGYRLKIAGRDAMTAGV